MKHQGMMILCALLLWVSGSLSAFAGEVGSIQFLESTPEETDLDLGDFPQAWQSWPDILSSAESQLSVASFYFSRQGDGEDASAPGGVGDRLLPSLAALSRAGLNGVQVRVLGDGKFQETYPEALAWLDAQSGVESRHVDYRELWGGGVMHAKYFLVDDHTLFIGSQNWDWRAMTQIRELGALVQHRGLSARLQSIFDLDWDLAGPEGQSDGLAAAPDPGSCPAWAELEPSLLVSAAQDTCEAVLAASPAGALPDGVTWDLPLLLDAIDAAEERVRLQLLSYGLTDRQGNFWPVLDNALRAAGARGVEVQVILSSWSKARYSVPWIQSLAVVPNIEIRFSNIPEHSAGFIPYARVEHPKYLTVDGRTAWLGTSNWSRGYFYQSRNVSLFLKGPGVVKQLDEFFEKGWNSKYVETVEPAAKYKAPKRS